MKLPSIDTYAFPVTIPSTKKTISMRPFLVREEKLLLMAQESTNFDEQVEAVAQVIRNCTNNVVEPRELPFFDIEWLLVQLRIRSVGEIVTPTYRCNHRIEDSGQFCQYETQLSINLNDVAVNILDPLQSTFNFDINDQYLLTITYPSIYDIKQILNGLKNERELYINATNGIINIFKELRDKTTGVIYKFEDYSTEEKVEFADTLPPPVYIKLVQFLTHMPTVTHTTNYTCERCGYQHQLVLSGVSDFLA